MDATALCPYGLSENVNQITGLEPFPVTNRELLNSMSYNPLTRPITSVQMNDNSALAALETRLGQIRVPATDRPLGGAGTTLQIVADAQGFEVDVTLGFPSTSAAAVIS